MLTILCFQSINGVLMLSADKAENTKANLFFLLKCMTNRQQVFCNYIQYLKIRAENNFNFYSFMHDTVIYKIINLIYTHPYTDRQTHTFALSVKYTVYTFLAENFRKCVKLKEYKEQVWYMHVREKQKKKTNSGKECDFTCEGNGNGIDFMNISLLEVYCFVFRAYGNFLVYRSLLYCKCCV